MNRIFFLYLLFGLFISSAANHGWSDSTLTEYNEIIMNGCQTGVSDRDFNGSLIRSWIEDCSLTAKNHGEFVRCVARLTKRLKKKDIINGKEKDALRQCAAKKSTIILYNALIYTMENNP